MWLADSLAVNLLIHDSWLTPFQEHRLYIWSSHLFKGSGKLSWVQRHGDSGLGAIYVRDWKDSRARSTLPYVYFTKQLLVMSTAARMEGQGYGMKQNRSTAWTEGALDGESVDLWLQPCDPGIFCLPCRPEYLHVCSRDPGWPTVLGRWLWQTEMHLAASKWKSSGLWLKQSRVYFPHIIISSEGGGC